MYTSHANYIGESFVAESPGSMVDMGPLINRAGLDKIDELVKSAVSQGGTVVTGGSIADLDEAVSLANDTEYGLTSSIYTTSLSSAMHAVKELRFGETYVNPENFEAMRGFHAGVRKSGIGGADGKHGVYEYIATHIAYAQT